MMIGDVDAIFGLDRAKLIKNEMNNKWIFHLT